VRAPFLPFREITGSLWCRVMTWLAVRLEWWAGKCRRVKPLYTVLSLGSWYLDEIRFWGQ